MEPKVFSSGKTRTARGFSTSELKKANIDIRMAQSLGLRVDLRRKTAYDDNIRQLKEGKEALKKKKEATKKTKKKGTSVKKKKTE